MALSAAEAIIRSEGYKGLSARKVASAIGYTAGTLYLVFDSLDDLVLQLNGRTLDELYERLQVGEAVPGGPLEKLMALAEAYIDYADCETERWSLLFEYVAAGDDVMPDWYEQKLAKMFGRVEEALKGLADRHSELEIQQTARVLWASVHGICTLKIRHRMQLAVGQDTNMMTEMLIRNFLKGFAA